MLVFLVFCAIALSEMASDVYVPGLPYVQEVFGTSKGMVQLTVSINLGGVALSSLLYGILSDCYGRRNIFLIGFSVFTISSLLCCFSQDIYFLIIMRFFQGFGAGVASVVGHASVKDLYTGIRYAQIISRLSMVISLSPAIAPILGSLIISRFSWYFVFVVIFAIALIVLIMLFFFFQETLGLKDRERFHLSQIFNYYSVILCNRTFVVMMIIQAFTFMWLWNEIANLPFLFINTMGMKIEYYGYFIAVNVLSYIVGTLVNHKFLPKLGMNNMLLLGVLIPIFPDILLILLNSVITLNPFIITIVWIPSLIGLAFIITNSIALALSAVPHNASARASACLGFAQMISAAIAIYAIGSISDISNIVPISLTSIICSICALLTYSYGYKNKG